MTTALTFLILTVYLAFTMFLGICIYKWAESRWLKFKERLNAPRAKKPDIDDDERKELERLRKLVDGKSEVRGQITMDSISSEVS